MIAARTRRRRGVSAGRHRCTGPRWCIAPDMKVSTSKTVALPSSTGAEGVPDSLFAGVQVGTAAAVLLVTLCYATTASAARYNITWVLSGESGCNCHKSGCYWSLLTMRTLLCAPDARPDWKRGALFCFSELCCPAAQATRTPASA